MVEIVCVYTWRTTKAKVPERKCKKGERKDGCTFQLSHADIQEIERNETHATLQCETDLRQIIWKIRKNGRTRRFEAKRYERNGSFVTAETTIWVNETVNVICITKTQSRSEMDRVTLHPYEGLWSLSTILTHC